MHKRVNRFPFNCPSRFPPRVRYKDIMPAATVLDFPTHRTRPAAHTVTSVRTSLGAATAPPLLDTTSAWKQDYTTPQGATLGILTLRRIAEIYDICTPELVETLMGMLEDTVHISVGSGDDRRERAARVVQDARVVAGWFAEHMPTEHEAAEHQKTALFITDLLGRAQHFKARYG